jgi:hypothetical protein
LIRRKFKFEERAIIENNDRVMSQSDEEDDIIAGSTVLTNIPKEERKIAQTTKDLTELGSL